MIETRARRRARKRWIVAVTTASAVVALTAGSVGIALALAPNASMVSEASRERGQASVEALVSSVSLSSGSLVGGEQQTIVGRGLSGVVGIRVGGVTVDEIDASDRALTFSMPRSERYVAGPVTVQLISEQGPVGHDLQLMYTYEVRTSVDRQLEYAFRHWEEYNLAEFGTFNPVGGDCVNFVSQTLIARGWEMTSSWHNYDGGAQWTGAWIHVPTFDRWLRNNPQYGAAQLTFDQRDQVKVGDLVVFDWNDNNSLDHIQVVSAVEMVDGVIEIKMVGHNRDTDFRDLDDTLTIDHPGGIGYFWSIPAS